ncbi:DUF3284 domain-containing protein [Lactococcus formosensis]|uniref:DUF3284 domain-containing protein n=1 Tax=Lactococcus formosensis TaxID=1281486 RepID=UPI0007CB9B5D|nr:DUF3284 domain-containing protein [Lactococcus formosensis]BAV01631.1 hypothetical protein NALG_0117 [Lactococcus formosensis]BDW49436.1 hypothetical protein LG21E20_10980 [Lactococcus formosensis]BDX25020.1 hypothetical protein LFMS200408A_10970 [Lactococcus formosensis]
MKISKTINAPVEFVYNQILDSSLYDIEKNTGRRPDIKSLNGFEYSKTFGKNQYGTITIDEVVKANKYAFTTKTVRNTFNTRWSFLPVDDKKTEITIEESRTSSGMIQKLNDMFVGTLLGHWKKRQMVAILNHIEQVYSGGK